MIIGFVLLMSSCSANYCNAIPVSDDVYQSESQCQQVLKEIHQRRPAVILTCGEVYRGSPVRADS